MRWVCGAPLVGLVPAEEARIEVPARDRVRRGSGAERWRCWVVGLRITAVRLRRVVRLLEVEVAAHRGIEGRVRLLGAKGRIERLGGRARGVQWGRSVGAKCHRRKRGRWWWRGGSRGRAHGRLRWRAHRARGRGRVLRGGTLSTVFVRHIGHLGDEVRARGQAGRACKAPGQGRDGPRRIGRLATSSSCAAIIAPTPSSSASSCTVVPAAPSSAAVSAPSRAPSTSSATRGLAGGALAGPLVVAELKLDLGSTGPGVAASVTLEHAAGGGASPMRCRSRGRWRGVYESSSYGSEADATGRAGRWVGVEEGAREDCREDCREDGPGVADAVRERRLNSCQDIVSVFGYRYG